MAKKGVFLVLSRPSSDTPEGHEAFNKWYDEHHVPGSLLLPGFVKGRRFKLYNEQLIPAKASEPGFDYVALYELDDLDRVPEARALTPKLGQIFPEFFSPVIDQGSLRAFVLEETSEVNEPSVLPEGAQLELDGPA